MTAPTRYYASTMTVADLSSGEVTRPARIDRWFYNPKFAQDGSILALIEQDRDTWLARIDPGSVGRVKDFFPSFHDYHDMVMFHPKFGYYASGRVSFSDDYQTFPIVLAPVFGHMVAEHLFKMWDGMRKAGTLGQKDTFTIGEFGAGDGALAESILEYIQSQAGTRQGWAEFAKQAVYV